MYRNAWPLLALATYRQICERAGGLRAGKTKTNGELK